MSKELDWETRFRAFWREEYVGSGRSPDPAMVFIREILSERDAALRKEIEGMKGVEHIKEWVCKDHGKIRDYFSHNDRRFCETCGGKLELKEYDTFLWSPENETLDQVLALLDKDI